MNISLSSLLALPLLTCFALAGDSPASPRLSASGPAARWDFAYPVGNGTMGAIGSNRCWDEIGASQRLLTHLLTPPFHAQGDSNRI